MSVTAPTISMRYAERILSAAERAGLERRVLLEAAPLHPVDRHGDPRIPGAEYYALWTAAMERTRDPAFPLRVAQSTGLETYEVFGFAMITSSTFREGLQNAARYLHLWTDVATWELTEADGRARLSLVPGPVRHPGSRFGAECALAEVVHNSRRYLGLHWKPIEVVFPWKRPPEVSAHEQLFEAPLKFEQPFAALVFDAALLERAPLKADPQMAQFFRAHADELLARLPKQESAANEVRRFVTGALARGAPTLEQAAKHLATSERTLRRRLAAENQTFAGLVHETRCALAKQYLAEGRLSLAEIAFVLGFSEVSAFHRSFRRWTGSTPGAWRAGRA